MLEPLLGPGRAIKMNREPLDVFETHFWLQSFKTCLLGRMRTVPPDHYCRDPGPHRVVRAEDIIREGGRTYWGKK